MQKIYLVDIKDFSDEERLKSLLPPDAVTKAEGYANKADKIRSFIGALLVEKFTAKEPCYFGAHGKPYKKSPPSFSLSHSGDKVGIFLNDKAEVGFDIQLIKPFNAKIAERIFHEKQIKIACAADFAKFWTMKEASAKLTGEGITNPEKQILTDIGNETFVFCGKQVYYKTFVKGKYAITTCTYDKIAADISEITAQNLINC